MSVTKMYAKIVYWISAMPLLPFVSKLIDILSWGKHARHMEYQKRMLSNEIYF